MLAAARTRFTELTLAELLSGLGKDGRVGYSGGGGADGDGAGRRWERVQLAHRSGAAGEAGIGVGETASGTAVVKRDAVARNGIAVLVSQERAEGLGQLRSCGNGLIIAAGDGDVGGGSGYRVLDEDVGGLQAGRTRGDRNCGDGGRQPQIRITLAIGIGDHGRRIGNGALVGGKGDGNTRDTVVVSILNLGDERLGEGGTGGGGLLRSAVAMTLIGAPGVAVAVVVTLPKPFPEIVRV